MHLAIWFEIDPRSRMVGEGIALHLSMLLRAFAKRSDLNVTFVVPGWSRYVVDNYLDVFKLRSPNINVRFISSTLPLVDRIFNWQVQKDIKRDTIKIEKPNWGRIVAEHPAVVKGSIIVAPLVGVAGLAALPLLALRRLWSAVGGRALRPFRLATRILGADMSYNMSIAINRAKADVCFVPYVSWWQSHRVKAPIVVGVHDLVFVEFPHMFPPEELQALTQNARRMVWRADAAFGISPRVCDRHIVRYMGMPTERTFLLEHAPLPVDQFLPEGADKGLQKLKEFMVSDVHRRRVQRPIMNNPYWRGWFNDTRVFDEPYVYYPTQYRPYKNMERLIYAIKSINDSGCLSSPLRLVTTADLTQHPKVMKLITRLGMYEYIVPLLRLPVHLHAAAYANAAVSVSASEFEGGTPSPVSEAGSVGTPFILSRGLYLDHFNGVERLNQVTFEPKSISDLGAKLLFAIENRKTCIEINRELMACTADRTWDDAAQELLQMCNYARENPKPQTRDWRIRQRNIAEY